MVYLLLSYIIIILGHACVMRNRFLDGYSMIQYSNAPGIHYGADQVIFPGYTWVGYPVPLHVLSFWRPDFSLVTIVSLAHLVHLVYIRLASCCLLLSLIHLVSYTIISYYIYLLCSLPFNPIASSTVIPLLTPICRPTEGKA